MSNCATSPSPSSETSAAAAFAPPIRSLLAGIALVGTALMAAASATAASTSLIDPATLICTAPASPRSDLCPNPEDDDDGCPVEVDGPGLGIPED